MYYHSHFTSGNKQMKNKTLEAKLSLVTQSKETDKDFKHRPVDSKICVQYALVAYLWKLCDSV